MKTNKEIIAEMKERQELCGLPMSFEEDDIQQQYVDLRDLLSITQKQQERIEELKRLCKTMIYEIEEFGGFKTSLEIAEWEEVIDKE